MHDRTPEEVGSEVGAAMAASITAAIESAMLGLAHAIRSVREDQAEARETLHALSQRLDAVERVVHARTDHLA